MLNTIRTKYPTIAEAFDLIKLKGLDETEYVTSAITKAVIKAKKFNEIKRVAPFVYVLLDENKTEDGQGIANKIKQAYSNAKTKMKPTAAEVLKYFDGKRSTAKGKNVYVLEGKTDFDAIQ